MQATAPETETPSDLRGAIHGVAAVSIWAGWMAMTRLGVTTTLSAWDIAALRFGGAGLLLLPVVLRRGLALDRLGWPGLVLLVSGAGAPYALVAATGLRFAPAGHGGALIPGVMPLFVAVIAAAALKERFTPQRKLGFGLICSGVLAIAGMEIVLHGGAQSPGHALFLIAAFMWACFTVVMRRAGLAALHAAALVSVGSLVGYCPLYVVFAGDGLLRAPVADIATQAVYQGFFATVVALFLYARAVATLGASSGAAFGALVPVLAALFAIPLLGEIPAGLDWVAIALVSTGVYLASGGPTRLPLRARAGCDTPGA